MTTDQQVQIFLDEIDAAKNETEFWNAVARKDGPHGILRGHRVTLIQNGSELGGLTAIARDDFNRTVLVCVDLKELSQLRHQLEESQTAFDKYRKDEMTHRHEAQASHTKKFGCHHPADYRCYCPERGELCLECAWTKAEERIALLEEAARDALKYMQSKMPSNWRHNSHAKKLVEALEAK